MDPEGGATFAEEGTPKPLVPVPPATPSRVRDRILNWRLPKGAEQWEECALVWLLRLTVAVLLTGAVMFVIRLAWPDWETPKRFFLWIGEGVAHAHKNWIVALMIAAIVFGRLLRRKLEQFDVNQWRKGYFVADAPSVTGSGDRK